jgi:ABC-2 type transport system permease protein
MLRLHDYGRIYRALVRANLAKALEYRAQIVLWLLSGVFPLVMMAVWLAVVHEAGPISGWGETAFVGYYIAATVVYQLTFAWIIWQWNDDIRTGDLSVKLLKPIDPFHQLLSEQLGYKLFFMLVVIPIFILATIFLPGLHYPITPAQLVAFILSVGMGFLVNVFMATTFGMIAFWSTQSNNLFSLWFGVGQFLSGWIAPLPLFPTFFRNLASWLPFRYTLGFPVEILLGQLNWVEIGQGFLVSLLWASIFFIFYRRLWKRGLRRYEAVGA